MKKYLPIILILVIMTAILGFSSQDGETSNGMSEKYAAKIEKFLVNHGDTTYDAGKINYTIRKLAHFTEYLILGVILMVGLMNIIEKIVPSIICSGLIGVGFAFIDETFQATSINRTSSLFDVLIDSLGVFVGLLAVSIYTFFRWFYKSSKVQRKRKVARQ